VQRLREAWPDVRIIVRADSGFCRWKMLHWCEWASVEYIIGLARNSRLEALGLALMAEAELAYASTGQKQRQFGWLDYAAQTWDKQRRVIAKAEVTDKGRNPRFVATNMEGDAQRLYDEVYCARGEMENRIKEQQLGLFSDRTSCHGWWANQFRVLLSAAAYVLMERIRRVGLKGTEMARAQVGTIRLKLLKIGAVIVRNTRRIRLFFSGAAISNQQCLKTPARSAHNSHPSADTECSPAPSSHSGKRRIVGRTSRVAAPLRPRTSASLGIAPS